MTELASRSPLQALSMSSSQRPPRRRSARLAFDEEDATPASKRTKLDENTSTVNGALSTEAKASSEVSASNQNPKPTYQEDVDGFTFARSRKTKKDNSKARSSPRKTPHPKRRSARLSGEKAADLTTPEPQPEREPTPIEQAKKMDEPLANHTVDKALSRTPNEIHVEKKRGPTKIALPFADTPIISRNKAMRKSSAESHRRSSSQLRGRRASSLMDSGSSSALPHSEVQTAEFYKHVSQDLPEPRRMKQLLVWCGSRALPERPTGDSADVNAALAARVVQEELLKDFSNKGEMSDWFSRDDVPPLALVKKPNPRNVQNSAKIQELEREVARLQQDKRDWDAVVHSLESSLNNEDTTTMQQTNDKIAFSELKQPLLSSTELTGLTEILSVESHELASQINTVEGATSGLEFRIDHFAERIYRIKKFQQTMNGIVEKTMIESAGTLDEREKEAVSNAGTEKVGIRDLLRSLSRAS